MLALLHQILDLTAALPRVEGPLPRTIGLSFPFTIAGAVGMGANLLLAGQPPATRERYATILSIGAFCLGLLFYLTALVDQLASAP